MLHFVSHMGMTRADESLSGSWLSRMWEKLVLGAYRGRFSVLCDSLGSLARSAGLERTGIDFMSIDVESLELPVSLQSLLPALDPPHRTKGPRQHSHFTSDPMPPSLSARRQVLRSFDWSIPVGFMVVETGVYGSDDKRALVELVLERGNMVKVDIGELPWYEAVPRDGAVKVGEAAKGKASVNTWFVRKDLLHKLRLKNGRLDVNGEQYHAMGAETTDIGRDNKEYAGAKGATMKREGSGCSPSPPADGANTRKSRP